ncbi:hypothetical protein HS1genome_1626 [Sulfodiicoccus acidiphilus]|uniref:Uncharacterized protein n=1 Tax=Sulfodiicoccus acidiphilus TaxID=1670455 RepID=A0A348B4Y5_9CREN|nr:hypothetical protein [Sulfodiicoccus acidiphilus]BBD73237.1 hypothetical protein HS1genome_1626 [Sulfodiicoccus acidiphilus]GGT89697.1 hypothetical protein GCM10007116_04430 [Sulfodiicoccus acidiphilus]
MMWNTRRHLELYLAVTLLGKVLHTGNARFHPSDAAYVIELAADVLVFYELDLWETVSLPSRELLDVEFFPLDSDYNSTVDSQPETI